MQICNHLYIFMTSWSLMADLLQRSLINFVILPNTYLVTKGIEPMKLPSLNKLYIFRKNWIFH